MIRELIVVESISVKAFSGGARVRHRVVQALTLSRSHVPTLTDGVKASTERPLRLLAWLEVMRSQCKVLQETVAGESLLAECDVCHHTVRCM